MKDDNYGGTTAQRDDSDDEGPVTAEKKGGSAGGWILGGWLTAVFTTLGGLFFQAPITEVTQARNTEAVREFAVAAGREAQRACPLETEIPADTYDAITGMYENRYFLRYIPFTAGDLLERLEGLQAQGIMVRAQPYHLMDEAAVFYKAADGGPDVLLIDDTLQNSALVAEYLDKVVSDAAGMAPGEKLVLHDGHSWEDKQDAIIAVPAGQDSYRVQSSSNPFEAGEEYKLQPLACKRDYSL